MTEMTEEAKKLKKEYMRNWRRANKDKVKRSQEKYWNNKATTDKLKG